MFNAGHSSIPMRRMDDIPVLEQLKMLLGAGGDSLMMCDQTDTKVLPIEGFNADLVGEDGKDPKPAVRPLP